jgi:hypothetical protein
LYVDQMVVLAVTLKVLEYLHIGTFIQFASMQSVRTFFDIHELERVTPVCAHDVLFYSVI